MPPLPAGMIVGVGQGISASSVNRFLLPASDCEFTLNTLLDDLQKDSWPFRSDERAVRCTGTALTVAAGLLGACIPGTGARIMAFVGGPCTVGSGIIVSKELSDPIRSHEDIDMDTVPFYHKAVKFYEGLAKQLVVQGHVLDLFACALDQVGIAEMKVAIERTGGLVVLAESFGHSIFKDSFRRVFESGNHALQLSFNGIFEVSCSKEIKVQGVIGPCSSFEKKGVSCSDTVIGQGSTTAWKLCGLDRSTTLTVFYDINPTTQSGPTTAVGQQFFLQFLTIYQHPEGDMRILCTTVCRKWVEAGTTGGLEELVGSFDQEAAAVVMARLASNKMG